MPEKAPPASSALGEAPWRLRFAKRILQEDLREIGHAAYETAKKAIDQKLRTHPEQYGEPLRAPLQSLFKLKSSHVRIAYHVERSAHEVWILMIGDRSVIWRHHEKDVLRRLNEMRQERSRRTQDKKTQAEP
ncbi:MAG: hypothetical protein H0U67_05510 [Gemmatimonadetes bacterium]|jgi:mRNA-degrading endonuclease RelE of RelBE toxin-antitoxin system|nr:hypothetical protein [Gemmatimonadota bacterium]MBA4158731.1 hypothetical protein [Gemmatimonadota bacterium]